MFSTPYFLKKICEGGCEVQCMWPKGSDESDNLSERCLAVTLGIYSPSFVLFLYVPWMIYEV